MWRSRGVVPKTASITGAAASRSGVTTSTWEGCCTVPLASNPSRWSCSASSSRVSEWQTCTSMLRSCAPRRSEPGPKSSSRRMAFCTCASRLPARWASNSDSSVASSPAPSTSPSRCDCVCRPQAASSRLPSSRCCASPEWPRAARWLSRRLSMSSNQCSWHGLSAYTCTSIRRPICLSQAMCTGGMAGSAKTCAHAGRPAARACVASVRSRASMKASAGTTKPAEAVPSFWTSHRHSAACQRSSARSLSVAACRSALRPSSHAASQSGR